MPLPATSGACDIALHIRPFGEEVGDQRLRVTSGSAFMTQRLTESSDAMWSIMTECGRSDVEESSDALTDMVRKVL
jgi:hypothetical protein